MSAEEKAADEIYCSSCGEVIKREAELCPECGVRNENAPINQRGGQAGQGGQGGAQAGQRVHDPTLFETDTSENWRYVVYAGVAVWPLAIALSAATVDGALGLGVLSIFLVPIGVYFDSKWVKANYPWNPSTGAYAWLGVLFGLLSYGFITALIGVIYVLYRRKARKRAEYADLV